MNLEANNFKNTLNTAATDFELTNTNLIKAQNALILAQNNFNSALNNFNTAQNVLNAAAASDFYHFLGEVYEILKKAAPNVPQNPQNAQFFYSLARAAISHEDYAYAEQILLWLCSFLDIAPVKIELGLLYLRLGLWERGFALFERRIELNNGFGYITDSHKQANSAKVEFLAQNANSDSMPNSDSITASLKTTTTPYFKTKNNFLAQKRVIIYCTQGAGDDLMFARFLAPLLQIAKKVFFGARSSQMRLFSAAFGENGSLQNYSQKAEIFEFNADKDMKFSRNFEVDFCFSLCSLPYFLGALALPSPFFVLDPKSQKDSIKAKNKPPKIALAWRTTSSSSVADLRSFSLKEILENFYFENAEFISIQTEPNAEECELMKKYKIKDESKNLKDFYSTFEILRKCDFALCLDSAPFHLAQAANIRTIAILPRYFEWRFGQGIMDLNETKIAPNQQNKIDSIKAIESKSTKSAKQAIQTKSPWYQDAKCFACPTLGDFATPLKAAQIFIKKELGL